MGSRRMVKSGTLPDAGGRTNQENAVAAQQWGRRAPLAPSSKSASAIAKPAFEVFREPAVRFRHSRTVPRRHTVGAV